MNPNVIFFRYDKYSHIDSFFTLQKEKLSCKINIINTKDKLSNLFGSDDHILVTFGEDDECYISEVNSMIVPKLRSRWIHMHKIDDVNVFNHSVIYCYVSYITNHSYTEMRSIFSIFTTCYNSYDKIFRAYNSIKTQTLKDWEWVIVDDSPDEEHFKFLKGIFKTEKRVRLYKRSENSGSIGNVKNEAVSLCRGKYVIELDHDDEILPDTLSDAYKVFEENPEVGFIYMDFINIYENGNNFRYSDYFGLGYEGYYRQKYNNRWTFVCCTANINNITLSHIVGVPNHPRIWRKDTLLNIGNYSEFIPVADDYELLLRTAVKTKMAKIHKMGYVQYMNNGSNNFSLIRNAEIQKLVHHFRNHCFENYKIVEHMKLIGGYEEEIEYNKQIWKRVNFEHKYCNKIINLNFTKQYCIIGLETLHKHLPELRILYKDTKNDFLLLDNKFHSDNSDQLCKELDYLELDRMRCYSMDDCSDDELVAYFKLIYKSCDDYYIYERERDNASEPRNVTELNINYLASNVVSKDKSSEKLVTLITPSVRPENLLTIMDSIRFEYIKEWLIVYDGKKIDTKLGLSLKNEKIKEYIHIGDENSMSGNAQRNFALDSITDIDTYLYFLDDDNIIHPDLYNLLDTLKNNRLYTFDQKRPVDVYPFKELLPGNKVELFNIDTAMFLIDFELCKNVRWEVDKYNADGRYITQCYEMNKDKWHYVNKVLSYYNYLSTNNK